jgi:hypothetical protein
MRAAALALPLLAAACAATPEAPPPPARPALPAGFVARRAGAEALTLSPDEAWRWLVSELTTLRADARGRNEDLLVTLEASALRVTDRAGVQRVWRLPEGLALAGVPAHVVLGKDLSIAVHGADGARREAAPEVTVVEAKVRQPGGETAEFRLVVKGGATFRSISTAG